MSLYFRLSQDTELINDLECCIGHVSRRIVEKWTPRVSLWTPRGHTRDRGRQKMRWRDDLDTFQMH